MDNWPHITIKDICLLVEAIQIFSNKIHILYEKGFVADVPKPLGKGKLGR